MSNALPKTTGKLFSAIAAFAIALTVMFLVAPASEAHADTGGTGLAASAIATQANDVDYAIALDGVPYSGLYGIYGQPGEKLAIKANAQYLDSKTWDLVSVKGATYKWTKVNSKLKATVKGKKLIVNKLPKAGTYKFTVTAFDADGKKLVSSKCAIVVKDKPKLKIAQSETGSGDSMFVMEGALFGWDNNTKKPFYAWTFKNLNTGKTAVWNSKKGFTKNDVGMKGATVAGNNAPTLMARFADSSKYQVTATMYHSNKVIATASQTVTV